MNETNTAELLQQLADIKGLNPVSYWPLAIGWWVVIVCLLAVLGLALTLYIRRRAWRRSWQGQSAATLAQLDSRLNDGNAKEILASLSTLLRRIAIRKYSRITCAGLSDRQWLQWLKEHDPQSFDWPQAGTALLAVPYAPPGRTIPAAQVQPLLAAAMKWVR